MDGSKRATGKEKHQWCSVVVGDFKPLFKQDGFSSVNQTKKKTFFRRHIRTKKCSRNKMKEIQQDAIFSHGCDDGSFSICRLSPYTKRFQAEDATVLIPNGVGLRMF
jgi:hypothetical protein